MEFNNPSKPGIGSVIPNGSSQVTSMSYHSDGNHLFVASEQDSKITMIDAIRTGRPGSFLQNAGSDGNCGIYKFDREGVSVVSATHNEYCVLSAGKKQNTHAIQYWSLYDNKILRKFRGHTSSVHEISLCPTEDLFLSSGSTDKTVRLWNLQQAGCMAKLDLPPQANGQGKPYGVFDSTGMVFCIMAEMAGGEGNYIHLYDARNYQGGAFSELKLTTKDVQDAIKTHRVDVPSPSSKENGALTLNKISFNESGNRILVQSEEGLTLVLWGTSLGRKRVGMDPIYGLRL